MRFHLHAESVKRRRPAIGFVLVTLFLDVLGIGLAIPVLPKLIESFEDGNVSAAAGTLGLLAALYSLRHVHSRACRNQETGLRRWP
jgi:hypothetical protein